MVKSISKIFLSILVLAIVCLVIGCDYVDLAGLFGSNDLDERLEEKDNFKYFDDETYKTSASFGGRNTVFPDDFSFIIVTDTHIEKEDVTDLEKIKGAITEHDAKFVAILGDITQNGSKKDFKAVTDFMHSLPVPCYPVIGNHDIYFGNWPEWKEFIGSTRYRVNGESVTLFILDSANAFIGKSQIDWLEKELKTAKGTVFVLTHSDLFVQDKIKIQQLYDPAERARIMSLLRDNNDKCKMMLMGHSHEWVKKEYGDVIYISIDDYKSTQKYLLVTVKNGEVNYEAKKL